MDFVSGLVTYIIIWWVVIFCVLPFGVSKTHEAPEGEGEYLAPGAPPNLNMKKKVIVTSIIAFFVWAIVFALIASDIINLRDMALQEM